MKKYITIILSIISILSLVACGKNESDEVQNAEQNSTTFEATILEIQDNYFLLEPVEGSQERRSADRIEVPMKHMDPTLELQVGDIIEIEHNGEILETYPARLREVYSIKVTKEAEQWDLIPMVMVNRELYFDTGRESLVETRCGMMDGEITSTVDSSETPTEDNQSNFGSAYGYQYGSTEGTIEININGKWWIYATQEAKEEMLGSR